MHTIERHNGYIIHLFIANQSFRNTCEKSEYAQLSRPNTHKKESNILKVERSNLDWLDHDLLVPYTTPRLDMSIELDRI